MPAPNLTFLLAEVDKAICAVRSAHDAELTHLTDLCRQLSSKTAEGKLNSIGLDLVDRMLKAGLQNKDIAAALGISRPAVTRHHKPHVSAALALDPQCAEQPGGRA